MAPPNIIRWNGDISNNWWTIRAGSDNRYFKTFKEHSVVGINWGLTEEFINAPSTESIRKLFYAHNPNKSTRSISSTSASISAFLLSIRQGDYFVTPNQDEHALYLGIVQSTPQYNTKRFTETPVYRDVKWIHKLPYAILRKDLKNKILHRRAVTRINPNIVPNLVEIFISSGFDINDNLSDFIEIAQFKSAQTISFLPRADIVSRSHAAKDYFEVPVFFSTNRLLVDPDEKGCRFGNRPQDKGRIYYGSAVVTLPQSHRPGYLESPPFWNMTNRSDPSKYVQIMRRDLLGFGGFLQRVRRVISNSEAHDAFIYIHGYMTKFDQALKRTAQIAFDLDFKGVPFLFSWPSKGRLKAYMSDEASAQWSVEDLGDFINLVVKDTGARQCHIIAHSMGNRVLINAMHNLFTDPDKRYVHDVLREIILAAPDIDRGIFERLVDNIVGNGERFTLYASSKDRALNLSKQLHDFDRLGLLRPNIYLHQLIDSIDASQASTGIVGHSYYGSNTKVLEDIQLILDKGSPPDDRNLLRIPAPHLQYWRIINA